MIEEKELIRTQLFVNIYIPNDCFSENCEDILFVTTDCTDCIDCTDCTACRDKNDSKFSFIEDPFKTFDNFMLLLSALLLMIYIHFIIENISLVMHTYI